VEAGANEQVEQRGVGKPLDMITMAFLHVRAQIELPQEPVKSEGLPLAGDEKVKDPGGLEDPMSFPQDQAGVRDVLQDVECDDRPEGGPGIGQCGDACPGVGDRVLLVVSPADPLRVYVTTEQLEVRTMAFDRPEKPPGAAPDLEYPASRRLEGTYGPAKRGVEVADMISFPTGCFVCVWCRYHSS
jgi:hypothetical protein